MTGPPVALVGPTGSGKSLVAMAVAGERRDVAVVAVDALQVYRGMDIGTAKPTAADRAAVEHYGLDLVDPTDEMSVTRFRRYADATLADLDATGSQALLVAGTGLYLTAIIDRLELPGSWPELRAQLEADDPAGLYDRLATLDPVAAARIEPGNHRRVVRALEVTIGSGRPFSSFGPGVATFAPSPIRQVGIRWQRHDLARRIDARVDAMIAEGLVAEVARLHAAGLSRTAAQGLGYKELIPVVAGTRPLDEAIAEIKTRTRQYAVRQERWFRRDPRIRWVDVDPAGERPLDPVVAAVEDAFTA